MFNFKKKNVKKNTKPVAEEFILPTMHVDRIGNIDIGVAGCNKSEKLPSNINYRKETAKLANVMEQSSFEDMSLNDKIKILVKCNHALLVIIQMYGAENVPADITKRYLECQNMLFDYYRKEVKNND